MKKLEKNALNFQIPMTLRFVQKDNSPSRLALSHGLCVAFSRWICNVSFTLNFAA